MRLPLLRIYELANHDVLAGKVSLPFWVAKTSVEKFRCTLGDTEHRTCHVFSFAGCQVVEGVNGRVYRREHIVVERLFGHL